jgi:hypothetical protein
MVWVRTKILIPYGLMPLGLPPPPPEAQGPGRSPRLKDSPDYIPTNVLIKYFSTLSRMSDYNFWLKFGSTLDWILAKELVFIIVYCGFPQSLRRMVRQCLKVRHDQFHLITSSLTIQSYYHSTLHNVVVKALSRNLYSNWPTVSTGWHTEISVLYKTQFDVLLLGCTFGCAHRVLKGLNNDVRWKELSILQVLLSLGSFEKYF